MGGLLKDRRATNAELVDEARRLLTTGFVVDGIERNALLEMTKPWRNEMWQVINEIELRLDPLKAIQKERYESSKSNSRPEHSD